LDSEKVRTRFQTHETGGKEKSCKKKKKGELKRKSREKKKRAPQVPIVRPGRIGGEQKKQNLPETV